MKHLKSLSGLLLLLMAIFVAVPGFSRGEEDQIKKTDDPKSITKGEVRIKLNSEYCKILVDGEAWEEQEFYDNGYSVVLYGVDRTQVHNFKLIPAYPKLQPVEFQITPKMWKIVRFKPGVKVWRATKRVKFKAKSKGKKKGKK